MVGNVLARLSSYNTVVKIGIVGLGFMGATHLAAYSKIADIEVGGIATKTERSLAEHLAQAGGNLDRPATVFDFSRVRQYQHWRELVLDPGYDVIDICLPTDLHTEIAITALAAGKHVLCEKPMALTSLDCDRMLEAADKCNRVLMIAHVLRFWPEFNFLHNFVHSRQGGQVRAATFQRRCGIPDWSGWLPIEARSGGAVLDLLVHDIDQALMLFGLPETITATPVGDVDAIDARLSYPNGLEVRIEGGWLASGTPFSMGFAARSEHALLELNAEGLFLDDGTGRHKVQPPEGDAYDAEIGYFVDCCRTGKRPDRCLPQQSAQAVKLALALKKARAKGGEPIKCSV
jgi:predicted dehydrogenase